VPSLAFVTHNEAKVREVRTELAQIGWELEHIPMEYEELQADTLEEVALASIRRVVVELDRAVMLEDAGLFVDVLGGFPGVYSSYVLGTIGWNGLLRLMKDQDSRQARFRSVIAYWPGNGDPVLFEGYCPGTIAHEGKGEEGFGFDPVFVPDEIPGDRSFAQMSLEEKNSVNHRTQSLRKLIAYLKQE